MTELCSSFPTLTSTQEVRSQTVLTTLSDVISTIPASITSVSTCGNSSCIPIVQTESPARTVTTQIPVTLTSQINTFIVSTLWGTTCTRSGSGLQTQRPTSFSSSTLPLDRTASPLITFTPVAVTPPSSTSLISGHSPVQFSFGTSASETLNAFLPSQTLIITPASTGLLPITTATTTDSGQSQGSSWGPIVGGVIGGVICLCALAVITWHLLKKRKRVDVVFEKVTPLSGQYQRFIDEGSDSSRQPFGGNQLREQRSIHNPWHQNWNSDRQMNEGSQSSYHSVHAGHHLSPSWPQVDPSQQQYFDPSSAHQWNTVNGQLQGQTKNGTAIGVEIPV